MMRLLFTERSEVQEMACIYGMIEVLFVRTPADVLKER